MPEAADNKVQGMLGDFSTPEALLDAIRILRAKGYTRLDALTPFPVHGMEEALGENPSRLGYIVAVAGIAGAAAALLLQWWTGAVAYPLVIGGKPPFAFEFSIPITFELTVLFSAFAAVLGMLALNKLPELYHPVMNASRFAGATDDRFLLVIDAADPAFHPEHTAELLRSLGSDYTEVFEG